MTSEFTGFRTVGNTITTTPPSCSVLLISYLIQPSKWRSPAMHMCTSNLHYLLPARCFCCTSIPLSIHHQLIAFTFPLYKIFSSKPPTVTMDCTEETGAPPQQQVRSPPAPLPRHPPNRDQNSGRPPLIVVPLNAEVTTTTSTAAECAPIHRLSTRAPRTEQPCKADTETIASTSLQLSSPSGNVPWTQSMDSKYPIQAPHAVSSAHPPCDSSQPLRTRPEEAASIESSVQTAMERFTTAPSASTERRENSRREHAQPAAQQSKIGRSALAAQRVLQTTDLGIKGAENMSKKQFKYVENTPVPPLSSHTTDIRKALMQLLSLQAKLPN